LRGKRWIVGSSNHSCWVGNYEWKKQQAFAAALTPGDVVYDVGANVGFYALLASTIAKQVYAFEPLPTNICGLQKHLRINRASNCTVVEMALGSIDGQDVFAVGPNQHVGRLSHLKPGDIGTIPVQVRRLDSIVQSIAPPSLMKVDIEGGEVAFLRGAMNTIKTYQPRIFLATHWPEGRTDCLAILAGLGYRVRSIDGITIESSDEFIACPAV
jgi:FkbM family methyltransferase